jgi:hypothetical protein
MAHDGPLAAGTRHRSPPRTSVPVRVDRTVARPSAVASANAARFYADRAIAARPAVAPARAGTGVPGRRTVTITGRGAERRVVPSRHGRHDQRRPYVPRHERDGFRPDRAAGLAVALALLLILVAAASGHAAVLHAHTRSMSAAVVRPFGSASARSLRLTAMAELHLHRLR